MTSGIFVPADYNGCFIYPRLPWSAAQALIEEREDFPRSALEAASAVSHPKAAPARIGSPISDARLGQLRDKVRSTLNGFDPHFTWPVTRTRVSEFDRTLGACLYEHMNIVPSDAAAEGVWSFLTLVLLPEIGPWRFPGSGAKRYRGVHRNVMRRTWWRAYVLGPDLGGGSKESPYLGEDELVQIFERSSLAANPLIARGIASAVHQNDRALPINRSDFVRDLTCRMLRLMPLISFDSLARHEFDQLVQNQIDISIRALSSRR